MKSLFHLPSKTSRFAYRNLDNVPSNIKAPQDQPKTEPAINQRILQDIQRAKLWQNKVDPQAEKELGEIEDLLNDNSTIESLQPIPKSDAELLKLQLSAVMVELGIITDKEYQQDPDTNENERNTWSKLKIILALDESGIHLFDGSLNKKDKRDFHSWTHYNHEILQDEKLKRNIIRNRNLFDKNGELVDGFEKQWVSVD